MNHGEALDLVRLQGFEIIEYNFTNNFSDKTNRKTFVSNLMFPVRRLTSLISQKINSLLWGGNSLVIFATRTKEM